jgi:hypothetical protein
MEKFTKVVEAKRFMPDPSILKRYAAHIVPLYLNGQLNCEPRLIDEYLELYKTTNKYKNVNTVTDLEIMAIKNIFENPTTITGFNQLKTDVDNKCIKLQNFLRKHLQDISQFK